MFKKFASDALGLSDIGTIIPPSEYNKTDSDDYVFHEDGEKIFFLIKSRQDEYCFTNKALIHLDGTSAVSKKRMLYRYDYYKYPVSRVALETAGTIDMDVEVKFYMGDKAFSIDVDKKQIEQLKDLYKALHTIGEVMHSNHVNHEFMERSIKLSADIVGMGKAENLNKSEELIKINDYIYAWLNQARVQNVKKDFSDIFFKYINN